MPTVVTLKGKVVPMSEQGDPAFTLLEDVLLQFTPEEVVAMVNRYLYQAYYSRQIHKERAKAETARQAPLRRKIREMFGVAWIKATDEQIRKATEQLAKEKGQ